MVGNGISEASQGTKQIWQIRSHSFVTSRKGEEAEQQRLPVEYGSSIRRVTLKYTIHGSFGERKSSETYQKPSETPLIWAIYSATKLPPSSFIPQMLVIVRESYPKMAERFRWRVDGRGWRRWQYLAHKLLLISINFTSKRMLLLCTMFSR